MRFYTKAELALVARLQDQGLALTQIAERIGRPYDSLKVTLWRTRRKPLTFSTEESRRETEEIIRLHEAGAHLKEIALIFGWSSSRVSMRLLRAGIDREIRGQRERFREWQT